MIAATQATSSLDVSDKSFLISEQQVPQCLSSGQALYHLYWEGLLNFLGKKLNEMDEIRLFFFQLGHAATKNYYKSPEQYSTEYFT